MWSTKAINLVVLVMSATLLASCSRSSRELPRQTLGQAEVLRIISDHNVDFDWWCTTGKVSIDAPEQSGSGKMYLRMRQDSIVWMVGKKASIEGVRMQATPDKVCVKYPIEKVYQEGSYGALSRQFDIDLEFLDLQHLLAGNVILPDQDEVTIDRTASGYLVQWRDNLGYNLQYLVNDRSGKLQSASVTDRQNRVITQTFDDYKAAEGAEMELPHYRVIEVEGHARMVLKLKEILVNTPKNTPFSISSRYAKVSF